MSADEFLKVQRDLEDAAVPRRSHPKGWEPGIDTAKGVVTAVSDANAPPSDWSDIIRELGLSDAWTVDESQPVQVRTWDTPGAEGGRMYYYKATVIPSRDAEQSPDIDALIKEVKRRKPKPPVDILAERALVVCLADWQAGKSDNGGVEALVERLMALKDAVPVRVKEAHRTGRPISALYVIGMGDMVEACDGHYAMQTFGVELDGRQQVKLVRRILTMLITEWSKLPVKMVVGCVPGNHGQARKNGKAYTTFEDNDDLAVFEQVQEILGHNPDAYGNISWVIPNGDMTITLDVCGTVVAFAHGHQFFGSGIPLAKARTWWKSKMAAMHPAGDATVLCYGHFHHLQVLQDGPRTIFGCPSNDGGSRWFEEQGGPTTACGTLTFVTDKDGWHDLRII
jgi:predicted phosphodiesterase